jgi:hypothetical protein
VLKRLQSRFGKLGDEGKKIKFNKNILTKDLAFQYRSSISYLEFLSPFTLLSSAKILKKFPDYPELDLSNLLIFFRGLKTH